MVTDPVRVSDHALVLYMQRVLDIDVEQLRAIIADSCARHQGAPCVRAIGARFLLRDNTVVTVLDAAVIPHRDVLVDLMRDQDRT